MFNLSQYKESINFIESVTECSADYGIILGTGLSDLVEKVDIQASINYEDIPHFPVSTVETHKGKLIFGKLAGKKVMLMQGRFHFYEGYNLQEVTFGVRVMKLAGVRSLFISNVSGGLNPDFETGDLMVLSDHINLLPDNPLRGKNLDDLGPRFPDMLDAYSPRLTDMALKAGKELGYRINTGVYVAVPGPNLETPAEYAFLRKIGADSVGMSTVPEVIVARHMGIEVFGISIITDLCFPGKLKKVEIPEIIAIAKEAQPKLSAVVEDMLTKL